MEVRKNIGRKSEGEIQSELCNYKAPVMSAALSSLKLTLL